MIKIGEEYARRVVVSHARPHFVNLRRLKFPCYGINPSRGNAKTTYKNLLNA